MTRTALGERFLDALGLDADFIETVIGDLAEESAERATTDGLLRARLWYAREFVRSMPHLLYAAIRRGGPRARLLIATVVSTIVITAAVIVAFVLLRAGPPAGLVTDLADASSAILLNDTKPVLLGMRVVDKRGRTLDSLPVRYTWKAGAAIGVTSNGVITCTERGDAVVSASVGDVARRFVVRCRPVDRVEAASWIDLTTDSPPRELAFNAVGTDGRPVEDLRGVAQIGDSSVAKLRGMMIHPARVGMTFIDVNVGGRHTTTRVFVHERVASLAGLRPDQQFVATSVRLAQGDTIEWPLPKGHFWIKYIAGAEGDAPPSIWIEGPASCFPSDGLHAYRVTLETFAAECSGAAGATVKIAHGRMGAAVVQGVLAIDRM
jgi:hypothetical protein